MTSKIRVHLCSSVFICVHLWLKNLWLKNND